LRLQETAGVNAETNLRFHKATIVFAKLCSGVSD
jgi:hypothetical protein